MNLGVKALGSGEMKLRDLLSVIATVNGIVVGYGSSKEPLYVGTCIGCPIELLQKEVILVYSTNSNKIIITVEEKE